MNPLKFVKLTGLIILSERNKPDQIVQQKVRVCRAHIVMVNDPISPDIHDNYPLGTNTVVVIGSGCLYVTEYPDEVLAAINEEERSY